MLPDCVWSGASAPEILSCHACNQSPKQCTELTNQLAASNPTVNNNAMYNSETKQVPVLCCWLVGFTGSGCNGVCRYTHSKVIHNILILSPGLCYNNSRLTSTSTTPRLAPSSTMKLQLLSAGAHGSSTLTRILPSCGLAILLVVLLVCVMVVRVISGGERLGWMRV